MSLPLQPTFGLHKYLFSTTAGWLPPCSVAAVHLGKLCFLCLHSMCCGPAVILALPPSAPLSLHPSLPVAHCITFIPVFHPAPCHSPKRSSDALVSPHPPTSFLVSRSVILFLGRICRHVNPNPAAWHLWRVEPGRLCCTSLEVQGLSEGKTVLQAAWAQSSGLGCGAHRACRCGDTPLLGQEPALPGRRTVVCPLCSEGCNHS